jgi:hypothetical protein
MRFRTDPLPAADERELSRQLVRLIDVMYALVLVQGAIYYRRIFTRADFFDLSHKANFIPVLLALILVYFTAIQSFVDFHLASETHFYRITLPVTRTVELARFYIDVLIVAIYSFLLLKFHVLIDARWADLSVAFWAFPVIAGLYALWGLLRRLGGGGGPYSLPLLLVLGLAYVVLALTYEDHPGGWERNAICLGIALAVMLLYRMLNWPRSTPPTPCEAAPVVGQAGPGEEGGETAT